MGLIEALILFYFLFCILVGCWASSKGRSGFGFFILSVLTSPMLGGFCVLMMRENAQPTEDLPSADKYRKCPFCAEFVKNEAVLCKHCRSELKPEIDPGGESEPSYIEQVKLSLKEDSQMIRQFSATEIVLIVLGFVFFIGIAICVQMSQK